MEQEFQFYGVSLGSTMSKEHKQLIRDDKESGGYTEHIGGHFTSECYLLSKVSKKKYKTDSWEHYKLQNKSVNLGASQTLADSIVA